MKRARQDSAKSADSPFALFAESGISAPEIPETDATPAETPTENADSDESTSKPAKKTRKTATNPDGSSKTPRKKRAKSETPVESAPTLDLFGVVAEPAGETPQAETAPIAENEPEIETPQAEIEPEPVSTIAPETPIQETAPIIEVETPEPEIAPEIEAETPESAPETPAPAVINSVETAAPETTPINNIDKIDETPTAPAAEIPAPSPVAPPAETPSSAPAPAPQSSKPSKTAPPAYQVVARRYRPQTFEELIGQGTVARALSNAIETNRVGHAYLFTGARGVGKTSCARIFAKALNCVDGPTTRPCLRCDSCVAVSTGDDVDVIEIDGASNRGVDEIRLLRQNATIAPSRSNYKIYIIDEVHMLTREAFNALLKTLEEPPARVKFIFCTTEPNKIPITILSRCQRFDFLGVNSNSIASRLAQIAAQEGAEAEPGVFEILARRANGSMRDAQSLLEQLLSFAPTFISEADARGMLGSVDDQKIFDLLAATLDGDAARVFEILGQAAAQGVDFGVLVEQTLGVYRDLMVVGSGCGANELMYSPVARIDELRKIADELGIRRILASLQILDQTAQRMRFSAQSRILTELAFARLCRLDAFQAIETLISQMRQGAFPPSTPGSLESDVKKKNNALTAPVRTPAPEIAPKPTPTSAPAPVPNPAPIPTPPPAPSAPARQTPPAVPAPAPFDEPPYFAVADAPFETEIDVPDEFLRKPPRSFAASTAPPVRAPEPRPTTIPEKPISTPPTASVSRAVPVSPDADAVKIDATDKTATVSADWLNLPESELRAIWLAATQSFGMMLSSSAATFCGIRAVAPDAFEVVFPGDGAMQRNFCSSEKAKIEPRLAEKLGGPVALHFSTDATKTLSDSLGADYSDGAPSGFNGRSGSGGYSSGDRSAPSGGSFNRQSRSNAAQVAPQPPARDLLRKLDGNDVVQEIKDLFEAELTEVRPTEKRR